MGSYKHVYVVPLYFPCWPLGMSNSRSCVFDFISRNLMASKAFKLRHQTWSLGIESGDWDSKLSGGSENILCFSRQGKLELLRYSQSCSQ